jgi:hypothetical protein
MTPRMRHRHWDRADNRGKPPEPGYFELQLVRGGPWLPARILHDAELGLWTAEIDGERRAPVNDPEASPSIMRIWHGGRRSNPESHAFLAATKQWAREHMPTHPLLHPLNPVDVTALPPVLPT